ncbi:MULTISPECIES: GNAT family N-acetyltransferase [Halocynthiibacter]|uniref:L-ornithine N(alpha)-acyltransferase n=1 Tax=Halocynthiibacter halioticoli TaxID=2986804 RepID=A0AAE3IXX3_9RHOB|nr:MULTISPECIES: GNAT family N-acyltransferase [Halocynthiibacter]MCV6824287.1 GNAT family N-acetyltransferase [Halocynthiibacter halioticoli]MCW4057288.1 GNAT family N-acetyltransferase [Halocynthiibacter sp. SDUM655004]MDE0589674.1 GNAT family N-acetyltransferase [Halocynthiibacter sp. C4]
MSRTDPKFETRLAQSSEDLRAAQRLRYRVFIEELGGDGDMVDHENRLEMDAFDAHYDHLLLIDHSREGGVEEQVVGVYRLLLGEKAAEIGQFYSENEYDLTCLKQSGRKLLELGRSCVHPNYRGGTAMFHLWNGLAEYVLSNGVEILFGVASFHGTNVEDIKQSLAYLHHNHLAPEELRVRVVPEHFQTMDLVPTDQLDRRAAMVNTPALIKAYLRLGGFVGEGAYLDYSFNTTDVCLLMDTERMNAKHKNFYTKARDA